MVLNRDVFVEVHWSSCHLCCVFAFFLLPPLSYERRCWVTFEHSTNIKEVIARISANLVCVWGGIIMVCGGGGRK